jgi:arsenical pump membrane protein
MTIGQVGLVWSLSALATAAIMIRPWRLPEAIWPVAASLLLVLAGVLSPLEAFNGARDGTDVYLFLGGMMLLAELAREEGLFNWLAAQAAHRARGSARRLFFLVYLVGTLVTVFLSNDATAVVLTPAVVAVTRAARIRSPLPFLFVCAFVANAASFVLPISNPANLVVYGAQMPSLWVWLARFTLPSLLAIGATLIALYLTQLGRLNSATTTPPSVVPLSMGGRAAGVGILLTALALMGASAASIPLGLPTLITALATVALVSTCTGKVRWQPVTQISWSVFPLVAGLFILVRAVEATGLIGVFEAPLVGATVRPPAPFTALAAGIVALVSNLANNLPVGLFAGRVLQSAQAVGTLPAAVLVGVDVGPNLAVTGSLATLLWLSALRREGIEMRPREFLRVGALVMPPALILAVGAILLQG